MTHGLFKYFSPNDADGYKLATFLNCQVFLTPPKYLNDPWEFRVQSKLPTEAEVRAEAERFEYQAESTRGMEEKERSLQAYLKSVTGSAFRADEGDYFQENLSKVFGVVSLTSDPLNRSMWAHYADSYRGFVAEFKSDGKMQWEGLSATITPFGPAVEVSYDTRLHRFDPSVPRNPKVFSGKHLDWGCEKEWRVIRSLVDAFPDPRDGNVFRLLKFPPESLLRVIFGLRVCPELKRRLFEMLENPDFAHVRKESVKIDADSDELITAPLL